MDVFGQAVGVEGADRVALLDRLCAGNADLRRSVERMLALDADAGTDHLATGGGAMLSPGVSVGTTRDADSTSDLDGLPALAGHYRIIRRLGEGGMGVVYLAEQSMPQRLVALKAVHSGVGRGVLQRFKREAHILGRLHHPGIAQIYEAGIAGNSTTSGEDAPGGGRAYIVIEFVDGPTLTGYADQSGLGRAERLQIFVRVCDAVQHAHLRRVIHRDLKPQNILVDPSGQPKVLDFGIARLDADDPRMDITRDDRALLGTPAYMSPEQLSGSDADARTDVYALGVVLFQLVTKALPQELGGKSIAQVMQIVRTQPARRASSIDPSLAGELDAILAVALHADPAQRYQSADALASDVRRFLAGEPILARTESLGRTLTRVARKHRAVVALAALLVGALAAAAGIATVMARRNRILADAAIQAKAQEESKSATLREALYVSRVGHAQAALGVGDVLRAAAELNACPDDQRGWEWRHLNAGTDASEARFELPFPGAMVDAAPDGSWLIAGRSQRPFRMIDAATGTPGEQLPNSSDFGSLRVSPDGKALAIRRYDGTVEIYDIPAKASVRSIQPPALANAPRGGAGFTLVDWLPDGGGLVGLRFDSKAFVCSAVTGEIQRSFSVAEAPGYALEVSHAPGEHEVGVSAHGDQSVRAFSVADGTSIAAIRELGQTPVALALSPIAPIAAVGMFDGRILLWNWRDSGASPKYRTLQSHASRVITLAFSPDGATLASGGEDRQLRTWDVASGTLIASQAGESSRVRSVRFTSDSRSVLVVGEGKVVRRFAARPRPLVPTAALRDFPIFWCATPADGKGAIVTTRDGFIARVDLETGLVTYLPWKAGGMRGAMPTPAGDMVLALDGGRIVYADPRSGRAARTLQELPEVGTKLAASPDGTHLIAWQHQGDVACIDWKNRGMGRSWKNEHRIASMAVGASASGAGLIAVGEEDSLIRVVDENGASLAPNIAPRNHAWSLAFSSDGTLLAAACEPSTILVWEWRTGTLLHEFKGSWASIGSLAFLDQDRRLAGGGSDHIVHVWRLPGGEEVLSLAGHRGSVQNLAVAENGRTLISADGMGIVKVWRSPDRSGSGE